MAMAKTDAGQRMLKDRSSGLSRRERAALILMDGQRSLEDVLAATSAGGITRADIERLVALGLAQEQPGPVEAIRTRQPEFTDSSSQDWARYVRAYGIATELAAELPRKDFELSLAIDAAGSLAELQALAPRLRADLGPARFARLDAALKAC